jgi:uncharacterized protein YxeA
MKKLIIFAIAILTVSIATAQTQIEKQAAASFVTDRANVYVKDVTPVFVKDLTALDRIEKDLDSGKYNYRRYSFIFLGEMTDANMVGGEMKSYTQDRTKPVLYYTIVNENGRKVIWVISGHNGF